MSFIESAEDIVATAPAHTASAFMMEATDQLPGEVSVIAWLLFGRDVATLFFVVSAALVLAHTVVVVNRDHRRAQRAPRERVACDRDSLQR